MELKKIPLVVKLYNYYKTIRYNQNLVIKEVFNYNKSRFYKYSGAFRDSKGKDLAYLTWFYHQIDKGLAMHDMRLGFGQEKIVSLNETIDSYICKYGDKDTQLLDAIAVLFLYDDVHKKAGFQLPAQIQKIINDKREKYPSIPILEQDFSTPAGYYARINSNFKDFSASRHSIRNFVGEIPVAQIVDAIDIAKNAPSACNRQPSRVHVVVDKKLIAQCLSLQNGNRGFGNLVNKLLVITGDLSSVLGAQEFFDLNTNVGIFIMNLSYALHYNKVAHCILNWYVLPKEDKKLRNLLQIPDEESVVCFIACGDLPERFKIVSSPRITAQDIYTIH